MIHSYYKKNDPYPGGYIFIDESLLAVVEPIWVCAKDSKFISHVYSALIKCPEFLGHLFIWEVSDPDYTITRRKDLEKVFP